MNRTTTKKLIEVALPLEAINKEAAHRKRKAPAGYPTMLHKWWAQRPVAAARAVLFAQMVDDPSSHPDIFPTPKKQDRERQRLFRIIEDLVLWENTKNEDLLARARDEIWNSWRASCAANVDHPRAHELFRRNKLPPFHDPFAGSGALPLEAQRLGLESYASDLNPVAVLINKGMVEIPPKFSGSPPVSPDWQKKSAHEKAANPWQGARGLADDIRYYGAWMSQKAKASIGHLFPEVEVTNEMAADRADIKPIVGRRLPVVAWLWARTVKSPNPAFGQVAVPLVSTFMLSSKEGRQAYVEPILAQSDYRFAVRIGKAPKQASLQFGTRAGKGQDFLCLMSGVPVPRSYIREEAKAGRLGVRLMATVAEGERGRLYLPATPEMEQVARCAGERALVDEARLGFLATPIPSRALITGGVCSAYGLSTLGDLFTARQIVTLTTFSDLIRDVRDTVRTDAVAAGFATGQGLDEGGVGAEAYADAIATYLSMAISRLADYGSSLATWRPKDNAMRSSLAKQAMQMSWDFAEGSPFASSSSGFLECVEVVAKVVALGTADTQGFARQGSATQATTEIADGWIVSTDPPYYSNISYAELSDFFYAWLRRSLKPIFPTLFATLAVPKSEELVAIPFRHGGKQGAEAFFLDGMGQAMRRLAERAHPAFPVTIYYAFKQEEEDGDSGLASTGWDTFLDAAIGAGFSITGTWPMRTESDNRQVGVGANALASSIILVCRPRPATAATVTRREFIAALRAELPPALANLQRGNIAPVDLAQAAIGPGMAVYTRYARVLDAEGNPVSVRDALALINQTLDEVLAEQEGDFDADTRWALAWFEQHGFDPGEYGVAETLSKAKNTSVGGLVDAGILSSKGGKVRLLKPSELPDNWDPEADKRLTVWEMVHHLVRVLEGDGEAAASKLVAKLGAKAEIGRELAYRLYALCDRKKRAPLAGSYNGLVQSWPELSRLAREPAPAGKDQTELFATK